VTYRTGKLTRGCAMAVLIGSSVLGAVGATPAFAETSQRVYVIDRNAGQVRFGSGITGKTPSSGRRVPASYRTGAGAAGGADQGVLVQFDSGDLSKPVWTGSLWNSSDRPPS
jgi:hypothetical protein